MNEHKKKITEAVFNLLKMCPEYSSISIDNCYVQWWKGGRSTDTMRLTDAGFKSFVNAEIEYHKIPIGNKLGLLEKYGTPNRMDVFINKIIRAPFIINWGSVHRVISVKENKFDVIPANTMMLFDDKETVSIILRGGKLSDILL